MNPLTELYWGGDQGKMLEGRGHCSSSKSDEGKLIEQSISVKRSLQATSMRLVKRRQESLSGGHSSGCHRGT